MYVCLSVCVCAPRGAANAKGLPGAGGENAGVAERAGKGKIREGSSQRSSKAKVKGKNEAHISEPAYDADDDDGDAEDTHTRTQNEGFSYGVTAALQGS